MFALLSRACFAVGRIAKWQQEWALQMVNLISLDRAKIGGKLSAMIDAMNDKLVSRLMGKLQLSASLVLLFAFAGFGEILSSDRRITWDPGVRSGIPTRTTIYTTLSSSATAASIQSALNACPSNQVVQLAAGTFNISSTITIPSGVTLRGAGIGKTILKGSGGFSGNTFINFNKGFNSEWTGTSYTLVSPQKGSASITTSAAHGWKAGSIVLIDMLEQPSGDPPIENAGSLGTASWVGRASGNRPIGQWVKIVSVPTTTTATIDPPLYWSYANTPQGVEMTGLTHYGGVEDLTVDNLTSSVQDAVGVFGAINCWLYRCEFIGQNRRMMWGYGALWFTMQGCRVTGGIPIGTDNSSTYDSDRSYGPFLGPHFSAGLFTDNIFEKLTMGIAYEGCVSGNVFSYNLITNIWWKNTGDAPRRFGPLMHGPHPFMNLIEGNWSSDRIRADEYWGTSSHFVALRNRVVQTDRGSGDSQTWTVDIERRNWYWSFVGNLLGGGGVTEDNYEYINGESAPYGETRSTIWKIGYNSLGTGSSLYDSGTLRTMVRWGNWSARTNDSVAGSGVVFHTNGVANLGDTVIPNSYYLSGKPSFFGGLDWPPYNPYKPAANSLTNIPAGYRYVYGTNPPSGGTSGNQAPTAVATATTATTGVVPLAVGFSSTGSSDPEGTALSYSWNFGDGNTSTAAHPSHTYTTAGAYVAQLTVSDGTNSNLAGSINITATAPVNLAPAVSVNASPKIGVMPLLVTFTSAGTSDPEGSNLTYNWTFGDGGNSTAANPTHTYSTAGNFTAKLTASDGTNSTTSSNLTISVSAVATNYPPSPVAGATPTSGSAPLVVTFSSAGSSDPEGSNLTYNWTFGDGTSSTAANPSHAYQTNGSYVAQLTVSDGTNSVAAAAIAISVADAASGLVAAFSFDEGSGDTTTDVSGKMNSGTVSNATWTTAGKYGGALTFNGTDALVVVNSSASLNVTNAMTQEAWVYPTASKSSWSTVMHRQTDAYYLHASCPDGAMRPAGGAIFNGTESYVASAGAIPLNTWTHLAATYDGTTLKIYINGTLSSSKTATGDVQSNANPLRIGGNYPYGQFFEGKIDEVRVYNRALSQSEIQASMNTALSGVTPPQNLRVVPSL